MSWLPDILSKPWVKYTLFGLAFGILLMYVVVTALFVYKVDGIIKYGLMLENSCDIPQEKETYRYVRYNEKNSFDQLYKAVKAFSISAFIVIIILLGYGAFTSDVKIDLKEYIFPTAPEETDDIASDGYVLLNVIYLIMYKWIVIIVTRLQEYTYILMMGILMIPVYIRVNMVYKRAKEDIMINGKIYNEQMKIIRTYLKDKI